MIDVAYWHWIVFGVVLILGEIFLTTFFVLWFGVAAILVGMLSFFVSIGLNWQILIWTVLSSVLALAWFRYLKPLATDKTKAGLAREAIIGETGQVIAAPNGERRGQMRFPIPMLGAEEWTIISKETLSNGDRVRVVDISGNALVVEKA